MSKIPATSTTVEEVSSSDSGELFGVKKIILVTAVLFILIFAVAVIILLLCSHGEKYRRKRKKRIRSEVTSAHKSHSPSTSSEPASLKTVVEKLILKGKLGQQLIMEAEKEDTSVDKVKSNSNKSITSIYLKDKLKIEPMPKSTINPSLPKTNTASQVAAIKTILSDIDKPSAHV